LLRANRLAARAAAIAPRHGARAAVSAPSTARSCAGVSIVPGRYNGSGANSGGICISRAASAGGRRSRHIAAAAVTSNRRTVVRVMRLLARVAAP